MDTGRLLRLRAMVNEAAQVEATHQSARALVHAYRGLQTEMLHVLDDAGLSDLREEFERLFPPMEDPREVHMSIPDSVARAAAVAAEAQMGLRRLQGWIQGLIDEQTLELRLRLEAEEKAKLEGKPATGFGASQG
ncbi:MAG TPA: hypothetical protein VJ716_08675 [Gaiellaceae bacterium]|nr:hypothetical protein [Gaiellaceae bacterium]